MRLSVIKEDRETVNVPLAVAPVTKGYRADDKVYLRLSHAMVIGYNPAVVNSETLLAEIRKCDKEAAMAGF